MSEVSYLNSHTTMYGVFGDPIRHSRSPLMMNHAFAKLGINGAYAAFHVSEDQLEEAVRGIRSLGFRGVNVTIPHKVNIMSYLDEIDQTAKMVGAVNTIVNEDGKLIGYNTDGIGYVRSLKEEASAEIKGKNILVLGAGGAARGVVHALTLEQPKSVHLWNRTRSKAEQLAQSLDGNVTVSSINEITNPVQTEMYDIVINTTSIGMDPNIDQVPLASEFIHPHMLVSDLIYNPLITTFLKQAELKGARIHGGLGMFIFQGAFALEYWTGKPAPTEDMRAVVLKSLHT